ncbi:MAG: kelch repeat-containing protein, partial [bacterium]
MPATKNRVLFAGYAALFCGLALPLFCAQSHGENIFGHTQTLLPDGNIFIAGGSTAAVVAVDSGPATIDIAGGISTNTTSRYNFKTALFERRSDLETTRKFHTATLLHDGRVLIAGGADELETPTADAELYDPVSDSTSPTANTMTVARWYHTATLLKNGRVLICGGRTTQAADSATDDCRLFDPATNSFSQTVNTNMQGARSMHTATLLASGRVFVAGGINDSGTYMSTTETYDPGTDFWTPGWPLLEDRAHHSASVMNDGNVLIAGGYNAVNKQENQGFLESAEIYNPFGGRVTTLKMPYRNSRQAALVQPDGSVELIGGLGNITTSYFTPYLTLASGSKGYSDNIPTSSCTATINGSSIIRFPVDTDLSSTVNGVVVDGDALFSVPTPVQPPNSQTPSITLSDAKIYINASTAPLDGEYIGMSPAIPSGKLKTTLQLTSPGGTIFFEPRTVYLSNTVSLTGGTALHPFLLSGESADLTGGSLTGEIKISMPTTDLGGDITTGTVKIIGGNIDGTPFFSINSLTSDSVDLTTTGAAAQIIPDG